MVGIMQLDVIVDLDRTEEKNNIDGYRNSIYFYSVLLPNPNSSGLGYAKKVRDAKNVGQTVQK